jgi:dipeptide transport system ATP-binding protein
MNILLEARNLTRTYDLKSGIFAPPRTLRALGGVSLALEEGRTLAVVGESGCGKSTLARLITMIEPPSSGSLSIGGAGVQVPPGPALRAMVQIVFQNPYGSLNPRQRIGTILEEPLAINRPGMTAAERRAKAEEMMALTGLRPEHYDRYPHMFSGGQRQRIAIARALMTGPRVLVLDEPVSALDLSIRGQILNLLTTLQSRLGLAYLFISHDLSVVRHMADRVMVMYLGRPVEEGPKEAVFALPRHPYTAALMSATPVAEPGQKRRRIVLKGELPTPLNVPPGCPFHPRCWKAEARCKNEIPEQKDGVACHFPLA